MTKDTEIKVINILRYMAWNRAKGHLYSILDTYKFEDKKKIESMENSINQIIEIMNKELP